MDKVDKIDYDVEVLDRPGLTLQPREISELQAKLSRLGRTCFDPLPDYQVFETSSGTALNDKIIVTAEKDGELFAFLSTVVLPIPGLDDPVIHTGLAVIHPSHRQTGVLYSLFGGLFLHLVPLYPKGFWMTSLSRIMTSLGHLATYIKDVYPSPQWDKDHHHHHHHDGAPAGPSDVHLLIARDIDAKHRAKMLILPEARFDEREFVFRAPRYTLFGPATIDDANDPRYEHRNPELTRYYRKLLRGPGDEVLQVAYFDPEYTFKKGERLLARL